MTPPRPSSAPLPPIRFDALGQALLARAEDLVAAWLRGGRREGQEWKCGDLTGAPGRSMSVNLRTGAWADFDTEARGGDLVSLYGAIHGLSPAQAALAVAEAEGLEDVAGIVRGARGAVAPRPPAPPKPEPPPRQAEPEGWRSIVPVPSHAPAATFRHHARQAADITHTAEYRVGDALYGYVVRFRTSDGGKDTLPYTWCESARDGACRWHWKTWDEPRPLYFPSHRLAEGRTVVLVEGERKADVLQAALDAGAPGVYCVAGWPGGSKAWKRADWSMLAGAAVLLWPDCDAKREPLTAAERKATPDKAAQVVLQQAKPLLQPARQPGMAAMLGIGALLASTQGCTVQLLAVPEPGAVPDGWDCADAIEADGWDFARLQAFLATAHALPQAEAYAPPAAAAGGGGKKIDGPADAGDGGSGGGGMPWWLQPYWDVDKCRWTVSRKLVITALTHDPALADVLGVNLLSNNIVTRRPWPWAEAARPVTGADDLQLGQYLSQTYGLPSIPRAALSEAIETVAHGQSFHPVRDWLQSLQHDGKARIDKWLIHVLGESPDDLPPDRREYLALVGRFWLLGLVHRVMRPGCKFDYCPVLEGPGGLGKSTLVETLASTEYFSDTHFDVSRGHEGQEQVQGVWCYEIAELAGIGKAEIQLIKAFITAKVDRYRPSYGRVVEAFPRQCILAGTTNERSYLKDRTGNRRFWPIPVRHPVRIAWLQKWRDQLFAEAYQIYLRDEPYTPTREQEERLFVPMQEARLVETAVQSELWNVLTRDPTGDGVGQRINNLTTFVTLAELTRALGVDAAKSSPALEAQIRGWLEHEGWKRNKKQINGVRAWGYEPPSPWPPRDETPPPPAQPPAADPWSADDDPF